MIRIIVLVPSREEYRYLTENIQLQVPAPYSIGKIKGLIFKDSAMFFACGGEGRLQFGLTAQYILDRIPSPDLFICAGSAGALTDKYRLKDMVIAEKTVLFDFKGVFQKKLPVFKGNKGIIEYLKDTSHDKNIYYDTIACGDEDVITQERANEIARITGAHLTAWEGAGGAAACRFSNVPFLEIRCISDICGEGSLQQFKSNVSEVMNVLMNYLLSEDFIKKHHSD